MLTLLIKLLIDAGCGVLDALGGYHWLFCRRFIMPALIGVSVAIFCHVWWLVFLPLPAMGTLCLGYSKDGNLGRALWIGLQCVALGLGLCLCGHLAWYFFAPYVILGCVLGGLYKNIQQIIGDMMTGCYMGLIIFLVH